MAEQTYQGQWCYCRWPDCLNRYDASTEEGLELGFYRHRGGVLLCRPHHDLGHHPGYRRDPDGNRATCSCGWAAPDPSPTLGDLIQAWADHAAHLGS